MTFGIKHCVTGTNAENSDVNLECCRSRIESRRESRTTPQIAQLLPAMERFIPEFILARVAM